jgi:hypothetical protein
MNYENLGARIMKNGVGIKRYGLWKLSGAKLSS